MANKMTGDYEAVLQVSVRQINGLLATLHQNGAKGSGLSPSFPHSVSNLRVGDLPKFQEFKNVQFVIWLSGAMQSFQSASGGQSITVEEIAAKAPPGAAVRFRAGLADIASAWNEIPNTGSVRGRAEVQISNPVISLSPGSTSEVTLSVEIRARFIPAAGFASLPEPIHGEVQVTYKVRVRTLQDGKRVLTMEAPTQDNQIIFRDFAGLNAADVAKLTGWIRATVRKEFKPEAIDLSTDFQFLEFKEIGGGNAIALPIKLSDSQAPAGSIQSVINPFLDVNTTDFAIAVSKEYIETTFQPTLDSLRNYQQLLTIPVPIWWDPTYRLSVTNAALQFKSGSIDLVVNAKAATPAVGFPNYNNIVITQRLTLALNGQAINLQASDSDLSIGGIPTVAMSQTKTKIIAERNKALPTAQASLSQAFDAALNQLNNALKKIDISASASYTAAEITPDGIIVRGAIDTKYHYQPQMEIAYTEDGNSFSALNCWIPGGRITDFTWYWVETPVFITSQGTEWVIPWFGKQKFSTQTHRFTFPIPAALKGRPGWSKGVCLGIEGYQVDRDGRIIHVSGFDKSGTCEVSSHEPILVVDPLWEAIYGILWRPDPAPDGILEDSIGAHINVLAHPRPAGGLTANALVYFVGERMERPLEAIGRALGNMRRRNVSLMVVLVLPEGGFRNRRGVVEEILGVSEGRLNNPSLDSADEERHRKLSGVRLLITEDYGGGWARTFDAGTTPASYLMNARGEFVWRQEEGIDIESLTAALDEHCLPAPAPRTNPLSLTVRPGERAPDISFEDGHSLALNRLRGRRVALNFWQSWSAPCIRELRRLQQMQDDEGENAPVILAVNGGEERGVIAEARRRHNIAFTLIHDAGQRISRFYGVNCWPTTVWINPDGIVERIQFGYSRSHRVEERGMESA